MRSTRLVLPLIGFAILAWQFASAFTAPPAQAQATVSDNMVDFDFDPAEIVVPAGTTVVWTNLGPTPHDVASADLTWSSEMLMTGGTYSYTFNVPGTYQIYCTLHPTMLGSITVTPS